MWIFSFEELKASIQTLGEKFEASEISSQVRVAIFCFHWILPSPSISIKFETSTLSAVPAASTYKPSTSAQLTLTSPTTFIINKKLGTYTSLIS
jgi:hypothetical protein